MSLACIDVLMLLSLPAWNAGVGTDRQGTLWGGGMGIRVPVTLGKDTGLGFKALRGEPCVRRPRWSWGLQTPFLSMSARGTWCQS